MILLVGAGGYIGSILAQTLSLTSHPFITISRSYQWQLKNNETRLICDLSLASKYLDLMNSCHSIVYMAGSTNILLAESNPFIDIYSHCAALDTFFSTVISKIQSLRKLFIISSSGTIYGDSYNLSQTEFCVPAPKSIYGYRNLYLEYLFSDWASSLGVEFSVLRLSNPFGSTQGLFRRKGLIGTLIENSRSGKETILRGNGTQKRDYIYSDDFSRIIHQLIRLEKVPKVLNIASGYSFTAIEIIDMLVNAGLKEPKLRIDPIDPEHEVKDSIINNNKLLSTLGLDTESLYPFTHNRLGQILAHDRINI